MGTRDDMLVYDTDEDRQAALLEAREAAEGLLDRALLQTFGPDEIAEARNRGFRPAVSG